MVRHDSCSAKLESIISFPRNETMLQEQLAAVCLDDFTGVEIAS